MSIDPANALLEAAEKATGDVTGDVTVTIDQFKESLGGTNEFYKATVKKHGEKKNPARDYCVVNRAKLVDELKKVVDKNAEPSRPKATPATK